MAELVGLPDIPVAPPEPARRRGPAPGASREQVLELAREWWLACRRIDVRAIAAECGVGRATVYRWFASREGLIAEAMLSVFEDRVRTARAAIGGEGAGALLDTISVIYLGLAEAPHIRSFIRRERATALQLMTSSSGPVHPRIVELIEELLDAEVERGTFVPPSDTRTLAYVLVRLAEALLFNYEDDEVPRNAESLRAVVAGLFGVGVGRG